MNSGKLLLTSLLLFAQSSLAGNYYSGKGDDMSACEQARERLIAPERERLIDKCIAEKKDAGYCENHYRDYGSGGMGAGGKYRKRLYNDIPACQKVERQMQRQRAVTEGVTRGRDADNFTVRESATPETTRDVEGGDSGR